MNQDNNRKIQDKSYKKQGKRKWFLFYVFGTITLFLLSFSATTFILMNSYRLTFAGENLAALQQEIGMLKNELNRKNNELEDLKFQIANIEGESSFTNQLQNFVSELPNE